MRAWLLAAASALAISSASISASYATDWKAELEEFLAFGKENKVALVIAQRCSAAYSEVVYGKSRSGRFMDDVAAWARAKANGKLGLVNAYHAVIVASMKSAKGIRDEMKRLQIKDREAFSRAYTEECRTAGIRALAEQ